MNRLALFICVVLAFWSTGCAGLNFPFWKKTAQEPQNSAELDQQDHNALAATLFVDDGRIINTDLLKNAQNLAIVPFTAGIGVEANQELDRTALMIVKGISDVLSEDQSGKHARLTLLTAENSNQADLIVKGHVMRMSKPSRLRQWATFKTEKQLRVSGKMIDMRTGEAVLIFTDDVESESKSEDFKAMGYRIGKNIGRFILSGV